MIGTRRFVVNVTAGLLPLGREVFTDPLIERTMHLTVEGADKGVRRDTRGRRRRFHRQRLQLSGRQRFPTSICEEAIDHAG
jgi:hypothetical protein